MSQWFNVYVVMKQAVNIARPSDPVPPVVVVHEADMLSVSSTWRQRSDL